MVTTDGRSRVRLPDGRRLDVWHGGDPQGAPLVFFHGTPGGRLQAALGDGAASRAGVRLVAFSRPGYGGSTDGPTTLTSVGSDAGSVADALGIDAFAVLGVSGGGPYAVAAAAVLPDRVRVVGVVAGVGPLLELDPSAADDPAVRAALAGDLDAAVALQDDAMTGGGRGSGPGDRAKVRVGGFVSPEILEPWTGSGRPGVPSYRGVSRDALAFTAGWDVDLGDVRAPVHLWYGDRDRTVGLEHGQWLHAHLPTSRLVVREGAGHLATLLAHWADVLTDLARDGG
ncbi:alpha/beta fold hydrolase [Terracoccus sp. 273MFTsu3.1]|uniref:alpha/beta fold hydrolase n=1 Tax=Terracoccus sp. 273MFTsu3.1 TaxID=1172188 RepID=UPI000372BCA6|nr:alpha/beta hydrolase [Terracoccus sp. 273MFTsu3.1]